MTVHLVASRCVSAQIFRMPPTGGGARVTRSSGAHTSADVDPRLRTPPSSPRRGGTDQSPRAAPGSRSHHSSPAFGAADAQEHLPSPGPPSAGLRVRRAKPTSVVDAVRKKKIPLPGQACWWCWHAQPDHHPDDCCERQRPNMVDFKQARVPKTRILGSGGPAGIVTSGLASPAQACNGQTI